MAIGHLIINVYADTIAQPVEGAHVVITGNGSDISLTTDSSGKTPQIDLEAPDKKYSLTPQKEVRPYETYNIKVTKPGLVTTIIEGVEVFEDIISIQDIYMDTEPEENSPPKIITIPDHGLWGNYQPQIKENPTIETRVLPRVLVPEYIVVHDGIPTNTNAANYVVLFSDYIKNVASHEIYSTWPRETIKANVFAILSFTLNRIFTEWYRSRGYNFTITSSPAYDQKYNRGGTIFNTISNVVDEVFNQYLKFPNVTHPFFAQYNDGIKVNNPGWLSQWRSKELGDLGYDALRIVRYFYGNTIYLSTAEIIEGAPSSFPGYNLALNSCGEAVQKMQNELNVINGSYPGIPKIVPADGKFGQSTKTSVEAFQKAFDMPVTGIIDFATWYRISYIYVAVSKMIQGIYTSRGIEGSITLNNNIEY